MRAIKAAKDIIHGDYVKLGGRWRGPVDWVESNPLCDSLLVHYRNGTYELGFAESLVITDSERPADGR